MFKNIILSIAVFAAIGALVFAGSTAVSPQVALPEAIVATTPCPVAGCTQKDSVCHAAATAPELDGSFEMVCPKIAGCADVSCHAWDRLTTHYNKPVDASLNIWILAPVLLTVGLITIARRMK